MKTNVSHMGKEQTTRILGIDPGTAIVGWGVIDVSDTDVETVAFGHIETPKEDTDVARLDQIAADLEEIITTYRPQEAAVEELFYFKNAKTVISVAQARGVTLHICSKNGLGVAEYTPLQIKQSLTSYGRADKKQMQTMVTKILGLSSVPQPDDTADALAVALCHKNARKMQAQIDASI